jgi:hypothetical protein
MLLRNRTLLGAVVASLLILPSSIACAQFDPLEIVRVDGANGSAEPPDQGGGWGVDAYKYLQDGLARAADLIAEPEVERVQVWIAATDPANPYVPYRSAAFPNGQMDPELTFTIEPDISWYGGFAGSEGDLDERDPYANETVLSGLYPGDGSAYQAYNVVDANFTDVTRADIIDCFTVTGG